jgi:hypothetical protein
MKWWWILLMGLTVLIFSPTAHAGFGDGVGLRAGFGIDPDQFVAGGQMVFGNPLKIARFAPSADIGFGDEITIVSFNGDLRLLFSPPGSRAIVYGQVGPTIAILNPKNGDSDTEIGLTLSAGLKIPMGQRNFYTLEGRIGFGDIPDFRVLLGLQFGGSKPESSDK